MKESRKFFFLKIAILSKRTCAKTLTSGALTSGISSMGVPPNGVGSSVAVVTLHILLHSRHDGRGQAGEVPTRKYALAGQADQQDGGRVPSRRPPEGYHTSTRGPSVARMAAVLSRAAHGRTRGRAV